MKILLSKLLVTCIMVARLFCFQSANLLPKEDTKPVIKNLKLIEPILSKLKFDK